MCHSDSEVRPLIGRDEHRGYWRLLSHKDWPVAYLSNTRSGDRELGPLAWFEIYKRSAIFVSESHAHMHETILQLDSGKSLLGPRCNE